MLAVKKQTHTLISERGRERKRKRERERERERAAAAAAFLSCSPVCGQPEMNLGRLPRISG